MKTSVLPTMESMHMRIVKGRLCDKKCKPTFVNKWNSGIVE
jgi:hypothetical protein